MAGKRRTRVLLFSGHMIDAPERPEPRFPPALEPAAAHAIAAELDALTVGPEDTAIASAACGGDTLFDEAALARGASLTVYLPFDETRFLKESVAFADARWVERFHTVMARARCRIALDVLGPLPPGTDPYERVNLWMLDDAKRAGADQIVFICLWNGKGGDGPGGTQHMMDAVRSAGGETHWIDLRTL